MAKVKMIKNAIFSEFSLVWGPNGFEIAPGGEILQEEEVEIPDHVLDEMEKAHAKVMVVPFNEDAMRKWLEKIVPKKYMRMVNIGKEPAFPIPAPGESRKDVQEMLSVDKKEK